MRRLFTSESVTEGHPDKICDQISDGILDAIIEKDPQARVACEVTVNTGLVLVVGEITTNANIDITKVARDVILSIGYNDSRYGFDGNSCSIITSLEKQSNDIAKGVDNALEAKNGDNDDFAILGAGDQGMMFGFASNETEEYMPLPISLSHKLSKRLAEVRKNNELPYLRPDGKTQVTVEYDGNIPVRIHTIVVSAQHDEDVSPSKIQEDIVDKVIKHVIPKVLLDSETKYLINPTGRFVIGGPKGDSGLTGRKIIVDTYGGYGRHGGGAFSGKDPTKVDRSGAYAARWVAKNLVAAGVADKLEIEVAYAIGVAYPVSIAVETFGTGKIPEDKIVEIINKVFDLRPGAIINDLNLRQPIYRQVASYGHFGRADIKVPWEELNKVEEIQRIIG